MTISNTNYGIEGFLDWKIPLEFGEWFIPFVFFYRLLYKEMGKIFFKRNKVLEKISELCLGKVSAKNESELRCRLTHVQQGIH